ncbi:hypothetical protein Taro_024783 [Colocasia esculenta]|uniref:Retrotransposon gag domain-containing protein n=1 Tax=Colocasia esculenta TaxID=4460 RepID=A0A843VLD6_COLES|nr:hypothetical protein [Colocasia esculenta]
MGLLSTGAGFQNWDFSSVCTCRQQARGLSTGTHRVDFLVSGQGFLSTASPSSVDRGCVNLQKTIPFNLQCIALWKHALRGEAGIAKFEEVIARSDSERSTTPTVVTSPVGCPRFSVSQAISSGLVPFTASILVYGLLELGEFPTEPVTSEAHPYSPQAKVKRKFRYRLPVRDRVEVEMADRRDWGGGGEDHEESTQRMIERIWESLTNIRMRMDQQASVPPAAIPPVVGVPVALVAPSPRVEVPYVAPIPPPVMAAEEPVMQVEKFLRLQLPTYTGGPNPDTEEHWIHEIERVFTTMRCPAADKVVLATYQLRGFAQQWWRLKMQTTFADVSLRKATPKTIAMRGRSFAGFQGRFGVRRVLAAGIRVKRGKHREIVGLCVLRGGSTTPTVVTSPVWFPRFSVSQAASLRLVSFTAFVLVYGFLELGGFPTEPVTSKAHPYSPQAKGTSACREEGGDGDGGSRSYWRWSKADLFPEPSFASCSAYSAASPILALAYSATELRPLPSRRENGLPLHRASPHLHLLHPLRYNPRPLHRVELEVVLEMIEAIFVEVKYVTCRREADDEDEPMKKTLNDRKSIAAGSPDVDGFSAKVLKAKAWLEMIERRISAPETPTKMSLKEPEVINTWELMEGLEDANPL